MENLKYAFLVALFAVWFAWIAMQGAEKEEARQCEQWQKESQEFVGWYATDWQVKQCKNYGIELSE